MSLNATAIADAVAQTNELYGGYDVHASRIVFPNGSIDPWHALGITQDISDDLPAVFIKGDRSCFGLGFWIKGSFLLHQ